MRKAFTLVELLVVIAVIALLAGLIIPMAVGARQKAAINRTTAELKQLETAIESYKSKRGHYPPDGTNGPVLTPLFYELTGVVYTDNPLVAASIFHRLHGGETIKQADVQTAFGMGGFINSGYVANPNDSSQIQQTDARDFLPRLEPGKYLAVTNIIGGIKCTNVVLGITTDGPVMLNSPTTTGVRINPWRYVSSNPTNNTSSYDLWTDIYNSGNVKRISNWTQ